jgi:hypothetical protein
MTHPPDQPDDDVVPVSVRLGEVVPPEDPEDWTKPLTWVAAAGMLLGPMVALAWFGMAPPDGRDPETGTWLLTSALALGAVVTGATQRGALRASTATVAAALFAALVTVILGAAFSGERLTGVATPTVSQAFGAAVGGLGGAIAASPLAAVLARHLGRWPRLLLPGGVAAAVAGLLVALLMGAAPGA